MNNKEKLGLLITSIVGGILIVVLIIWSTGALTAGLVDQTTDFFLPEKEITQRDQIYQEVLNDSLLRSTALSIIKTKEKLLITIDSLSNQYYQLVDENLAQKIPANHLSKANFAKAFSDKASFEIIPFFDTIQSEDFYQNNQSLQDLLPLFAKAKIDIEQAELEQLQALRD